MDTKPKKKKPGKKGKGFFIRGLEVDARDEMGRWYEGRIMEVDPNKGVLVHYKGWTSEWDTWFTKSQMKKRVKKYGTSTRLEENYYQMNISRHKDMFSPPPSPSAVSGKGSVRESGPFPSNPQAALWNKLKDKCGWRCEHQPQPRQGSPWHFYPPDMKTEDAQLHVDYFDSIGSILQYLEQDTSWKQQLDSKTRKSLEGNIKSVITVMRKGLEGNNQSVMTAMNQNLTPPLQISSKGKKGGPSSSGKDTVPVQEPLLAAAASADTLSFKPKKSSKESAPKRKSVGAISTKNVSQKRLKTPEMAPGKVQSNAQPKTVSTSFKTQEASRLLTKERRHSAKPGMPDTSSQLPPEEPPVPSASIDNQAAAAKTASATKASKEEKEKSPSHQSPAKKPPQKATTQEKPLSKTAQLTVESPKEKGQEKQASTGAVVKILPVTLGGDQQKATPPAHFRDEDGGQEPPMPALKSENDGGSTRTAPASLTTTTELTVEPPKEKGQEKQANTGAVVKILPITLGGDQQKATPPARFRDEDGGQEPPMPALKSENDGGSTRTAPASLTTTTEALIHETNRKAKLLDQLKKAKEKLVSKNLAAAPQSPIQKQLPSDQLGSVGKSTPISETALQSNKSGSGKATIDDTKHEEDTHKMTPPKSAKEVAIKQELSIDPVDSLGKGTHITAAAEAPQSKQSESTVAGTRHEEDEQKITPLKSAKALALEKKPKDGPSASATLSQKAEKERMVPAAKRPAKSLKEEMAVQKPAIEHAAISKYSPTNEPGQVAESKTPVKVRPPKKSSKLAKGSGQPIPTKIQGETMPQESSGAAKISLGENIVQTDMQKPETPVSTIDTRKESPGALKMTLEENNVEIEIQKAQKPDSNIDNSCKKESSVKMTLEENITQADFEKPQKPASTKDTHKESSGAVKTTLEENITQADIQKPQKPASTDDTHKESSGAVKITLEENITQTDIQKPQKLASKDDTHKESSEAAKTNLEENIVQTDFQKPQKPALTKDTHKESSEAGKITLEENITQADTQKPQKPASLNDTLKHESSGAVKITLEENITQADIQKPQKSASTDDTLKESSGAVKMTLEENITQTDFQKPQKPASTKDTHQESSKAVKMALDENIAQTDFQKPQKPASSIDTHEATDPPSAVSVIEQPKGGATKRSLQDEEDKLELDVVHGDLDKKDDETIPAAKKLKHIDALHEGPFQEEAVSVEAGLADDDQPYRSVFGMQHVESLLAATRPVLPGMLCLPMPAVRVVCKFLNVKEAGRLASSHRFWRDWSMIQREEALVLPLKQIPRPDDERLLYREKGQINKDQMKGFERPLPIMSERNFIQMLSQHPKVRELRLASFYNSIGFASHQFRGTLQQPAPLTPSVLLGASRFCRFLQVIELFAGELKDEDLAPLWASDGCMALHTVKLYKCNKLTADGLKSIATSQFAPLLKCLVFTDCQDELAPGLVSVAERCWGLHVLDLSGSARVGRRGLMVLRKRLMITLRALNLARCPTVGADHLHALLGGVPTSGQPPRVQGHTMAELNLSDCPMLRIRAVTQTLNYCQPMGAALRCLWLKNLAGMGDKCVAQIAKCCSALRLLHLSESPLITDYSAVVVFQYLKTLDTLNLDKCVGLTDHALKPIMDTFSKYQKLSTEQVAELLITDSPKNNKIELSIVGCPGISDAAIRRVLQSQQDQLKFLAKKHPVTRTKTSLYFKEFAIVSKPDPSLIS